jgi:hypothetical protein
MIALVRCIPREILLSALAHAKAPIRMTVFVRRDDRLEGGGYR